MKRSRSRARRFVILLNLSVAFILIAGWQLKSCIVETAHFPNISKRQIEIAETVMEVTFPPSTKFLFYYATAGLDDMLWLKIELARDEVRALIEEWFIPRDRWSTSEHTMRDLTGFPEFSPSTVSRFRAAEFQLWDSTTIWLLIDNSESDPAIVYLQWVQ